MTGSDHDDWENQRLELLAGYADGELSDSEHARVAAWLAEHPQVREDLEAHRRLMSLWQDGNVPEPGAAAWASVLERVEEDLSEPVAIERPIHSRNHRTSLFAIAGLMAAAAALLLLTLPVGRLPTKEGKVADASEPLPVASADDVSIESMDDADRMAVVIGEPPVRAPLELLTDDEVKVHELSRDDRGRMPRVSSESDSRNPLVIMSPAAGSE